MSPKHALVSAVLMVLLAGGALYTYDLLFSSSSKSAEFNPVSDYPIKRTVKYSFTLQNDSNRVLKDVGFWAYAPVLRTGYQWVESLKTNLPHRMDRDRLGNQRMYFSIDVFPPFATKLIDVTVALRMTSAAVAQQRSAGDWLGAQVFVETDDPALRSKAQALRGTDATETAANTFKWVKSTVENNGYVQKDRGAKYALSASSGDCSEHMYLYVALSRINDLPAQALAGFVVENDGVLNAARMHNWSQILLNESWQVVDTDRGLYAPDASRYLAMRILDPQSKFFGDGSQQLYGGVDGVSVRMN